MRSFYVYILASRSRVLYVGVTNNLLRRVCEHRQKLHGFTPMYNVTRLVHYEFTSNVVAAIAREKRIKGWVRKKKIALVEETNPTWRDLSEDWFD